MLKLIETEETDPKISLICGPTLSLRIFGNELDNSFELPIATNRSVKESLLATKVSKSIVPSIRNKFCFKTFIALTQLITSPLSFPELSFSYQTIEEMSEGITIPASLIES